MKFVVMTLLWLMVIHRLAQADELPTNFKTPEVNKSIESFEQMKKSTISLVTAKVKTYRQELIDKLKAQQEAVTKTGDLEEALKIKGLVGQLEAVQAAAQESVVNEGEKAAGKVSIPRGAVKFGNGRYYIVAEPATWNVARIKCGLKGGHLVRIESEAEHQFIVKLIHSALGNQGQSTWIDGNDEWEEGKWVYSNGKPIEYLQWDTGQPNGNSDNYLLINAANGLFHDVSSNRYMYICEWE